MQKIIGNEIREGNNRLSMSNLYRWQAQHLADRPEDYAAVTRFLNLVLAKQKRTTQKS